jgi:uncharacterized protein YneF (UPF0154 family)
MVDLDNIIRWLELLAHVVAIGGVSIAIGVFIAEKQRERQEHAFDELDEA